MWKSNYMIFNLILWFLRMSGVGIIININEEVFY